jgi:hypothetical protein
MDDHSVSTSIFRLGPLHDAPAFKVDVQPSGRDPLDSRSVERRPIASGQVNRAVTEVQRRGEQPLSRLEKAVEPIP